MDKIKILHIVPKLDIGGIEAALLNLFLEIDTEKYTWDFVVHGSEEGQIEKKLKEKGCKVHHVTPKKENLFKYLRDLKKACKSDNYDIIHTHQSHKSLIPLLVAKMSGKKIRIAHSHTCMSINEQENAIKRCIKYINRMFATDIIYCSKEAGAWAFGEKTEGMWLPNGVDVNAYQYDEGQRERLRNEFNIKNDDIVLGMVCRFSKEKNIPFSLNILKDLTDVYSEKFKLVLVGDGDERDVIYKKVKEFNLENNVIFTGRIDGTAPYYSMFDVFLLPSDYEGFPVSLVEAQCAGLNAIISSNISTDSIRSKTVSLLPIEPSSIQRWVDEITKLERKDRMMDENMRVFDKCEVAKQLTDHYDVLLSSK